MGNANRYKRNMADNPRCLVCDASEETTLHILRDCPAARMVWRKVGGPTELPHFFHQDLLQWVSENLAFSDPVGALVWATCFGITVWWLWRWRNNIMFGRDEVSLTDYGAFLRVRYAETRSSLEDHLSCIATDRREEVFVTWVAPQEGWYTLNTDGAAKGSPGPAGGGAIIRDHGGRFIMGMSTNFGHCNSFRAELLALCKGLEMAQNLQIRQLVVQVDNLSCVQILQRNATGDGECAHLINQCNQMINDSSWKIKIMHVYREGNRAADWLANQGVSQDNRLTFLDSIPIALARILDEDSRGVALPRFIPP